MSKALIPAGGTALCGIAAAVGGHGLWAVVIGVAIGATASAVHPMVVSWRRMAERQQFSAFEPDVRADLIDLERAQSAPAIPPTP